MKCPKCKTEMEEFMLPGGASMTFGGPNSGVMQTMEPGMVHVCPECSHEVETDFEGNIRKKTDPFGSNEHAGYGNR